MDGQKIHIQDYENKNLLALATSCDIPNVGEEVIIYGRDGKETRYQVKLRSMTVYQGSQNCTWNVFVKNAEEDNIPTKEEEKAAPAPAKTTATTKNNSRTKKKVK